MKSNPKFEMNIYIYIYIDLHEVTRLDLRNKVKNTVKNSFPKQDI